MATPKIPQSNSQPCFSPKCISSAPTTSTSTSTACIATSPRPSPFLLSSSSRASSTSAPTIATKMRTLWTNSHIKLFNNLYLSLNLNLQKSALTESPRPFSHTPSPPSSSPNGSPEKSPYTHTCDPLSGPTTRHAEYLFSRVDKGLLTPDCYSTPPPSSPMEKSPFLDTPPSPSLSYSSSSEYRRNNEKNLDVQDTDTDTDTKYPYVWGTLQKSCKDVLDNFNTNNVHTNNNIVNCDKVTTGQENGNRPLAHVDIENGEVADTYGAHDGYTEGRFGCDGNQEGSGNKLIRTQSRESFVEVLFDADGEGYRSSPSPCPSSSRIQKQNILGKALAHETERPISHSSHSPPQNIQSRVIGHGNGFTSNDSPYERARQARVSKEIEDAVNESVYPREKSYIYGEVGREVLVRDFAYMEMRPRARPLKKNDGEIENVGLGDEQGTEYTRGDGDAYKSDGNDDAYSRYAKSSLDLEEDEEDMGFDTEKSMSSRFKNRAGDTKANATTTTNEPRNNFNFNASLPPSSPASRPQPQHHSSSTALIHLPRTHPPKLEDIDLSISQLSLPSSIMDSTYLRGSEMQEYLMSCSLGESFFSSLGDSLGDVIPPSLNGMGRDEDQEVSERDDGEDDVGTKCETEEDTLIEDEDEDGDGDKATRESEMQLQLSPYTFPGTNMYLYEPMSKLRPGPISSGSGQTTSDREGLESGGESGVRLEGYKKEDEGRDEGKKKREERYHDAFFPGTDGT